MTNKELQKLLKKYPDDMSIKILLNSDIPVRSFKAPPIVELSEENILISSGGAWVDDKANPEIWDCEDGKIRHKGKRYLLFNPIIT